MSDVRRDRVWKTGVIAASVAGHVLVLALIGLNVPQVRERLVEDEDQVMAVDLFRAPPPPRARRPDARPSTIPQTSSVRPRIITAPAPAAVAPLPMAPVPAPASPTPAPKASGGAVGDQGSGPPGGDLRGALRGSTVGCANRAAVGLNRREVEGCDEKLGAGAKDAPYTPAPMDARKRSGFDARAASKARDRAWRAAPVPPGIDPKAAPGVITGLDKP